MPLIALLILALWTLVVVALLGSRATLSARTFATFLVLGLLMGGIILPVATKAAAPYGERGTLLYLLLAAAWQAALLLPLLSFLMTRGTYRTLSIADAFVLAFVLGFGVDLLGGVLAAGIAPQSLDAVGRIPPWAYQPAFADGAIAGYGYWTALVALAVVAARRFSRQPTAGAVIGALAFVYVTLDHAAALEAVRTGKVPTGPLGLFSRLTLHGALTAWIVILAVVALSVTEAVWVGRTTGASGRKSLPFIEEWRALIQALGHGKGPAFLRLRALIGLRRQARIAHAELRADPYNPVLQSDVARLDARVWEAEAAYAAPYQTIWPMARRQWLLLIEEAAPWAALLFLVGILPRLRKDTAGFWDVPLFRVELLSLPLTILNAFLVVVIVWRFLAAAGRPATDDPDDTARFTGETAILRVALVLLVLTVLAVDYTKLYPFPTVIGNARQERLPLYNGVQLITLLLLLVTAATGLTRDRSVRWRAAPVTERRAVGLHNALIVASLLIITFVNRAVYLPGLREIHQRWGSQYFNFGKHLNRFGLDGNSAAALTAALLTAVVGVALLFVVRWLVRRIEEFLVGTSMA